MAKIDFDHPDASGGPAITYGVDFDSMTAQQLADALALHDQDGAALAAAVKAVAIDADAQALLNKLVASGILLAQKAITSGAGVASLLGALGV